MSLGVLKKAASRKGTKPEIRYVTHDGMWAMKRAQQARDRRAAAGGKLSDGNSLSLRTEMLRGATVIWSSAPMSDPPLKRSVKGKASKGARGKSPSR